jgi:pimeloyl-ACP methyl ester carboxylesterase
MSTQYFSRQIGTIAYDDQGTGPLVVCAPSMGDVRAEYHFLAPALAAAGFRVVTMDLRGQGESSVDWPDYSTASVGEDLLALVRHLNAGPALLVGTSFSAGAAVWAAAEAPEWVSGLVLIGPFVRDTMPVWQGRLIFGPLFAGPWGVWVWSKYFPRLYPTAKPADFPQYLEALLNNLREPGRMAALRGLMNGSKQASEERLGQVQAPVLVIMGTRDPDFKDPAAEARLVAERVGGTEKLVEGAGHYPHAEMPQQVNPLVLEFARSVQRASQTEAA